MIRREFITWEINRCINRIKTMKWRTHEEFKSDPNKVCPQCGSENLDID